MARFTVNTSPIAACPTSRCCAEMRTLDCEVGSKNQNERPSSSTRLPASRGGSTYCSRLRKRPAPSALENSTNVVRERSSPFTYSVSVSAERNGSWELRTLSVAATISCTDWAKAAGEASTASAAAARARLRVVSNMAERVHDGEAGGAVGRDERRGHRHHGEHQPRAADQQRVSQHV